MSIFHRLALVGTAPISYNSMKISEPKPTLTAFFLRKKSNHFFACARQVFHKQLIKIVFENFVHTDQQAQTLPSKAGVRFIRRANRDVTYTCYYHRVHEGSLVVINNSLTCTSNSV